MLIRKALLAMMIFVLLFVIAYTYNQELQEQQYDSWRIQYFDEERAPFAPRQYIRIREKALLENQ